MSDAVLCDICNQPTDHFWRRQWTELVYNAERVIPKDLCYSCVQKWRNRDMEVK